MSIIAYGKKKNSRKVTDANTLSYMISHFTFIETKIYGIFLALPPFFIHYYSLLLLCCMLFKAKFKVIEVKINWISFCMNHFVTQSWKLYMHNKQVNVCWNASVWLYSLSFQRQVVDIKSHFQLHLYTTNAVLFSFANKQIFTYLVKLLHTFP